MADIGWQFFALTTLIFALFGFSFSTLHNDWPRMDLNTKVYVKPINICLPYFFIVNPVKDHFKNWKDQSCRGDEDSKTDNSVVWSVLSTWTFSGTPPYWKILGKPFPNIYKLGFRESTKLLPPRPPPPSELGQREPNLVLKCISRLIK